MDRPQTTQTPQVNLPDAREIIYTAAVLHKNSQDQLVSLIQRLMMEAKGTSVPKGWMGRAHHMTIKYRPNNSDIQALDPWFGKEGGVNLLVTDWAVDEYGVAVVVSPGGLPVANATPHITVGHSRDVGAAYSNDLLADRSKWNPIHEGNLSLKAYVIGVGPRDKNIPDMNPTPLAVPAFTF